MCRQIELFYSECWFSETALDGGYFTLATLLAKAWQGCQTFVIESTFHHFCLNHFSPPTWWHVDLSSNERWSA